MRKTYDIIYKYILERVIRLYLLNMGKKYTSIENYILENKIEKSILIISDWFEDEEEQEKLDFIVMHIEKSGRKPVLLTSLHQQPYRDIPTICDFKVLEPERFDMRHFLHFESVVLANTSKFVLYIFLVEKHIPFIWYLTRPEQLQLSFFYLERNNTMPAEQITFFKRYPNEEELMHAENDDIAKILTGIYFFSDIPNEHEFEEALQTSMRATKSQRAVVEWWQKSQQRKTRAQLAPLAHYPVISALLDYLSNEVRTPWVYVPDNLEATFNEYSKSKGNILMLIHEFTRTGTPVACLIVAKILKAHGYFVTVIGGRDGDGKAEFIEAGLLTVVDSSLLKDILVPASEIDNKYNYGFESMLSETDLVFMACILLYGLTLSLKDYNKNIFWWLHEGKDGLGLVKELLPVSISDNIKVYTGGVYAQRIMQEMNIQYNSKILDYGIEYEAFEQERVLTDKVKFLIAGTFCERKGQDIMAKAIRMLSDKEQGMSEFIFIGERFDAKIHQELEALSKENENCIVMDAVPYEAFKKLYATIDCVVCPSRDDPMPVVMTQALMMQKVAVCSTDTGTAYYINHGNNGYVFESEDAEALSSVLSYIINHKSSIESVGKKGYAVYKDYFHIDTFETKLMKEIDYLIEDVKDK